MSRDDIPELLRLVGDALIFMGGAIILALFLALLS